LIEFNLGEKEPLLHRFNLDSFKTRTVGYRVFQ